MSHVLFVYILYQAYNWQVEACKISRSLAHEQRKYDILYKYNIKSANKN